MTVLTIRATSLEYVRVRVSARASGAAVNPTGSSATMAFEDTDTAPAAADDVWKTASWDYDPSTETFRVQCLVGPSGTVALDAGRYFVFVKIADSPEVPIMPAGVLEVVA